VTSQPISATVTSTGASATVATVSSSVSIAGGVGPQGPAGTSGGLLEQLSNVQIISAQQGDVLQYGGANKWQNNPIIDGGNFLWPVLFAFVGVL
jgi:hypothetical protein